MPARRPGANRREVLLQAVFAGGALIVGVGPARALAAARLAAFGPFVKIAEDGLVTVVSKHSELGQGAHTGLAAIVAEELDADWSAVRVEMAPADKRLYGHTQMGLQITGGSSTIANSWTQLRKAGPRPRPCEAGSSCWLSSTSRR